MCLLKDSEELFPCRISNERFRIFGVNGQILLRSSFLKRVEMGHVRLGQPPATKNGEKSWHTLRPGM